MNYPFPGKLFPGGIAMKRKETEDLRLNPHQRICPKFDEESIALFPVADEEKMGVRVLDNCAEEHIM